MESCKVCGKREEIKACSRCKSTLYCSRICQKIDFKSHKKTCAHDPGKEISFPLVKKDPEHPCPICYEEEDIEGECGFCFECGNTFCGMCNTLSKMGKTFACPMCRNEKTLSNEERVKRLKILEKKVPEHRLKPLYTALGVFVDDPKESKLYLQKAVELGYPLAYYHMAVFLEKEGDEEKSLEYHRIAASRRDKNSQARLGYKAFESGDKNLAKHWYIRSAENGSESSMYNMGILCEEEGACEESMKWYTKAYENGLDKACLNIGLLLEKQEKYSEAYSYYSTASLKDIKEGYYHLGRFFENGLLGDPDLVHATSWYTLGMEKGESRCTLCLGEILEKTEEYTSAVQMYKKSIELGSHHSYIKLGVIYLRGKPGVKKDISLAIEYLKKACEHNQENAMVFLASAYGELGDGEKMLGFLGRSMIDGNKIASEFLQSNKELNEFFMKRSQDDP